MSLLLERITAFNANRDAGKIPLKYAAMRQSAFRFFRGSCHLFYEDLHKVNPLPVSPSVWLCGDLHLENAGSFKGSDRQVYFDINDFDEGLLGPALCDVVRFLTSVIVARSDAGNTIASSNALIKQFIASYANTLKHGKPVTIERETATGLVKDLFEELALRKEKKLVRDKSDSNSDYSTLLIDNKKTFPISTTLKKQLKSALQTWLNERHGRNSRKVLDIVAAVSGTGSIGVKRYLILVDRPAASKRYLLIVKQAVPSALQLYNTILQPSWKNEAERICSIQYRMQHVTPGDLGTFSFDNDWYITRWLQPLADKVSLDDFINKPELQPGLISTFGSLTASAQLRSSGRQGSAIADELIEFGNNEQWVKPVTDYAVQYATIVKKDYREFCRAYDRGFFLSKTING
ncbi:MAG: DUF2252 family protein [Chitinophagaceae bacterium]